MTEEEALTWAIWSINSMMDLQASSWDDIKRFDNGEGEQARDLLVKMRDKRKLAKKE